MAEPNLSVRRRRRAGARLAGSRRARWRRGSRAGAAGFWRSTNNLADADPVALLAAHDRATPVNCARADQLYGRRRRPDITASVGLFVAGAGIWPFRILRRRAKL
jgi:hypothetical protein